MPRLAACLSLSLLLLCANGATAELHDVITIENSYSPFELTIEVGDSVRWTNTGQGVHNVLATDASFRCADGCDATGGNGAASSALWSFVLTFRTQAEIDYFCEFHGPSMNGSVTVVGVFGDGFESGDASFWATP